MLKPGALVSAHIFCGAGNCPFHAALLGVQRVEMFRRSDQVTGAAILRHGADEAGCGLGEACLFGDLHQRLNLVLTRESGALQQAGQVFAVSGKRFHRLQVASHSGQLSLFLGKVKQRTGIAAGGFTGSGSRGCGQGVVR